MYRGNTAVLSPPQYGGVISAMYLTTLTILPIDEYSLIATFLNTYEYTTNFSRIDKYPNTILQIYTYTYQSRYLHYLSILATHILESPPHFTLIFLLLSELCRGLNTYS